MAQTLSPGAKPHWLHRLLKWAAGLVLAAILLFVGTLAVSLWNMPLLELISCAQAGRGTAFKTMCSALLLSDFRPTKDEVDDLNRQAGISLALLESNPKDVDEQFQRKFLRNLMDRGVDINAVDLQATSKSTALHTCAVLADLRGIRMLLDAGADPNVKDALGRTPLEAAQQQAAKYPSSSNYSEVIRLLQNGK